MTKTITRATAATTLVTDRQRPAQNSPHPSIVRELINTPALISNNLAST